VASLSFACEEYGRAVKIQIAGGRQHVLSPSEFRVCVAEADGKFVGRARSWYWKSPAKCGSCSQLPRPEHDAVVAAMRTVLRQCETRRVLSRR